MPESYRQLDAAKIVETAELLERRIAERFPEAGLRRLAAELCTAARTTAERAAHIQRPYWTLRIVTTIAVVLLIAAIVAAEMLALDSAGEPRLGITSLAEFLQTLEASLGALVFIGAAAVFVLSFETRFKRRRTLAALHELRSMAHIIDMHQLTKDPERSSRAWVSTTSSPRMALTPFELERYFDYCSEMLSLVSKVAALYVQSFPDAVATTAVDEIETLATGLSRKIWQKIMLLGRMRDEAAPEQSATPPSGAVESIA